MVVFVYSTFLKNALTFEFLGCCEFLIMACLGLKNVGVPERSLNTVYLLVLFVRCICVCVNWSPLPDFVCSFIYV
jgi:hypothetical protein